QEGTDEPPAAKADAGRDEPREPEPRLRPFAEEVTSKSKSNVPGKPPDQTLARPTSAELNRSLVSPAERPQEEATRRPFAQSAALPRGAGEAFLRQVYAPSVSPAPDAGDTR